MLSLFSSKLFQLRRKPTELCKYFSTNGDILCLLETYKNLHGNLVVQQKFTVPNDSMWPPWSHNFKLGLHVRNLRAAYKKRKLDSHTIDELRRMGFVWNYREWHNQLILEAISFYKECYGDCQICESFVIPIDGTVTPKLIRGREEDNQSLCSFDVVVGNSPDAINLDSENVPKDITLTSKENEHNETMHVESRKWPRDVWGWKLGKIAFNIRNTNTDTSYKDIKKQLLAIGFPFGLQKQVTTFPKVLKALNIYKEVFGNLWVPFRYVIPHDDKRYPLHLRGMPLGAIVRSIRHYDHYKHEHGRLKLLGFPFEPKRETQFQLIKRAIQTFQRVIGSTTIPRNFVVPSDEAYEKEMWGMKLGMICWRIQRGYGWHEYREEWEKLFSES